MRRFPVQTSLYGASKLAGEGLIAAYCEGFGFAGLHLPLRVDSRRALHARPRVRLLPAACARSDAAARARQRPAAQVVPLRAGLHRRHASPRSPAPMTRSTSSISAPTNTARCNDSIGWICDELRRQPGARVHRRRSRLDRRQPVHLPRHRRKIRALGWPPSLTIREGVIRTLRLPAGEPASCSTQAHERRGPRPLAPRLGDGRLPRRRRSRRDRLRPEPVGRRAIGRRAATGCRARPRRAAVPGASAGRLRFTTSSPEAVSRRRRRLDHLRHAGRRRRSRRRRVRHGRRSPRLPAPRRTARSC